MSERNLTGTELSRVLRKHRRIYVMLEGLGPIGCQVRVYKTSLRALAVQQGAKGSTGLTLVTETADGAVLAQQMDEYPSGAA